MNDSGLVRQWRVSGRVQGVGFRWFVSRQARALELGGWVRNLRDGDVAVVASGPAEQLEKLRQLLGAGPAGAVVEHVEEVTPVTSDAPRMPFSIIE